MDNTHLCSNYDSFFFKFKFFKFKLLTDSEIALKMS